MKTEKRSAPVTVPREPEPVPVLQRRYFGVRIYTATSADWESLFQMLGDGERLRIHSVAPVNGMGAHQVLLERGPDVSPSDEEILEQLKPWKPWK